MLAVVVFEVSGFGDMAHIERMMGLFTGGLLELKGIKPPGSVKQSGDIAFLGADVHLTGTPGLRRIKAAAEK